MNYDQIEAFLAIVTTQSLSSAAEVLYVSQSTISHRLSLLEAEINMPLVLRHKGHRSIELTPAGERFIPIAQRWKLLWDETTSINRFDAATVLCVGGVDSVCNYFLRPFFRQLTETCLDFKLSISTYISPRVYTLMEAREIDVGFVSIPSWNKNILLEPILEEPFKLVCCDPGQRWPAKIHPSNLDARNELFQPWGPEYQQWHDYWWPDHNQFFVSFDNTSLMHEFLESGKCWTIVPECIAQSYRNLPGFCIIDLLSPPPKRSAYLAVHRYPKHSSQQGIQSFQKRLTLFLNARKRQESK